MQAGGIYHAGARCVNMAKEVWDELPSSLTITIWAVGNPCCILGLPNKLKEKKVNKKYIVKLTTDERAFLLQMISTGKAAARKLLHARILLKADASEIGPGWTDEHISQALEVL